jgi:multiple sugar transport system ATP-binding protein
MNGGVLQQYDSPDRIFDNPVNTFVAGFVGSPAMNLVRGTVSTTPDGAIVEGPAGWRCPLSAANAHKTAAASSRDVVVGARHSAIRLSDESHPDSVPGRIYTVEPTGDVTYAHVHVGASTIIVSSPPHIRLRPNESVWVTFDQERLHLFDAESGLALQAA